MTADDPRGGTPNKPARPGRRFGDEEVGAILERAADLQGRSVAVTDGAARGLTLADLRQIAEEAGIDPRFVDLASADLAAPVKGTGIAPSRRCIQMALELNHSRRNRRQRSRSDFASHSLRLRNKG